MGCEGRPVGWGEQASLDKGLGIEIGRKYRAAPPRAGFGLSFWEQVEVLVRAQPQRVS